MNTVEKIDIIVLQLIDHGKIELGTPESKLLIELLTELRGKVTDHNE